MPQPKRHGYSANPMESSAIAALDSEYAISARKALRQAQATQAAGFLVGRNLDNAKGGTRAYSTPQGPQGLGTLVLQSFLATRPKIQ